MVLAASATASLSLLGIWVFQAMMRGAVGAVGAARQQEEEADLMMVMMMMRVHIAVGCSCIPCA